MFSQYVCNVKNQKPFILSLFLLQVFFLSAANDFNTFSNASLDLDSRQGEFFKADQNKNAILFEEIASKIDFKSSSENEVESHFSRLNFAYVDILTGHSSEENKLSEFEPNRRTILKTQIFPFHFFW